MFRRFREMKAEDSLTSFGAIISYRHEWNDVTNRSTGAPIPGPPVLRKLLGDRYFAVPYGVIVYNYHSDIRFLRPIASLRALRGVTIITSTIDDKIFDILTHLHDLREISLHGTNVTDQGIQRLASLRKLGILIIGDSAVTDAGRTRLNQSLPKCQIVDCIPASLTAA